MLEKVDRLQFKNAPKQRVSVLFIRFGTGTNWFQNSIQSTSSLRHLFKPDSQPLLNRIQTAFLVVLNLSTTSQLQVDLIVLDQEDQRERILIVL